MQEVSLSLLEIAKSDQHCFLLIANLYFILVLKILNEYCLVIEGTFLVLCISFLLGDSLVAIGFDIKVFLLLLRSILGWRGLLQFFDEDLCSSRDVEGL